MNGRPTIFIVDDEPAVLASIAALLQSDDWDVACCESADAFQRQYDPSGPACLLLDLRMPGMGGLELLSELRARGDMVPVIVITGRYDSAEAAQCLAGKAVAIFQKPFEGYALLECIREALRGLQASISLTSFSKRLSQEEAQELYRAILPPLVREVFRAAGGGENDSAVRRIVDHMCRNDVQSRLRQSEHVSDAIAAELTTVLNDFRLKPRVTKEGLRRIVHRARLYSSFLALQGCLG